MHTSDDSRIFLADEAATLAFAARLAAVLKPGVIIYLHGNLGAGKTTLVRGLLTALGYQGRVKSPTYALIEQYDLPGLNLRHFDLYRFRDAEEWEAAGFRDEFNGRNVCLVEWPEQAAGLLPQADLEIFFEIQPHGRRLQIRSASTTGETCLAALPD